MQNSKEVRKVLRALLAGNEVTLHSWASGFPLVRVDGEASCLTSVDIRWLISGSKWAEADPDSRLHLTTRGVWWALAEGWISVEVQFRWNGAVGAAELHVETIRGRVGPGVTKTVHEAVQTFLAGAGRNIVLRGAGNSTWKLEISV